jgi:hypothetical protein
MMNLTVTFDIGQWGIGEMIKQLNDDAVCSREWNGNDRVKRHYFGRVRLNESPLNLRLYWKNDDNSPRQLIGAYRIDLKSLLKAGYIREARGHSGEVILRFQRTDGGKIQIAINRQGHALTI